MQIFHKLLNLPKKKPIIKHTLEQQTFSNPYLFARPLALVVEDDLRVEVEGPGKEGDPPDDMVEHLQPHRVPRRRDRRWRPKLTVASIAHHRIASSRVACNGETRGGMGLREVVMEI